MNHPLQRPAIAVSGIGEVGPAPADSRSIAEMVLDAVEAALRDAGCGFDDIDATVTASIDLLDGLTASNIAVTEVVGAVMAPETRIAADGLAAVIHAACQLWAGAYERVLVVAHGKASMAHQDTLTQWALDPIFAQPLGVSFRVCAGLEASRLAARDPGAVNRWAEIAAHRLSTMNGKQYSAREVLASPIVASPIRELMCAPDADGACAVVLQVGARRPGDVCLAGVGHDLTTHNLGDRPGRPPGVPSGTWEGLGRAYGRACAMAAIGNSTTAFGLAEPSCRYAHEEDLFTSVTGIAPSTPMSPTGGLFAGAVPVVAGLSRFAAAVRRLRQVPETGSAVAHGTWGPAGQAHAVAILDTGATTS